MKHIYLLLSFLFGIAGAAAQVTGGVSIGTTAPDSSALLEVSATNKGLLIPRMTAARREAIHNSATGLQVYQTDGTTGVCYYDGAHWVSQTYGLPVDTAGNTSYYGAVTTLAGSSDGYLDAIGAAAQFSGPSGIVLDRAGNSFIADASNSAIRKVTPAGMVTTLAGSSPGYTDGTGSAAQFNRPWGIAADGAGNVFVADFSVGKIRKISTVRESIPASLLNEPLSERETQVL